MYVCACCVCVLKLWFFGAQFEFGLLTCAFLYSSVRIFAIWVSESVGQYFQCNQCSGYIWISSMSACKWTRLCVVSCCFMRTPVKAAKTRMIRDTSSSHNILYEWQFVYTLIDFSHLLLVVVAIFVYHICLFAVLNHKLFRFIHLSQFKKCS